MLNSPLRQTPRQQRAAVIPLKQESSLLDWLKESGKLIARDVHEPEFQDEEEEISELMGGDDVGFDDIDDDDEIELED